MKAGAAIFAGLSTRTFGLAACRCGAMFSLNSATTTGSRRSTDSSAISISRFTSSRSSTRYADEMLVRLASCTIRTIDSNVGSPSNPERIFSRASSTISPPLAVTSARMRCARCPDPTRMVRTRDPRYRPTAVGATSFVIHHCLGKGRCLGHTSARLLPSYTRPFFIT